MRKNQKVEVTWVDSHLRTGWLELENYESGGRNVSLQCRTIGYLLIDEKDRIGLLQSFAWTGCSKGEEENQQPRDGDAMMIIPRKAVVKIKELR